MAGLEQCYCFLHLFINVADFFFLCHSLSTKCPREFVLCVEIKEPPLKTFCFLFLNFTPQAGVKGKLGRLLGVFEVSV